MGPNFLSALIDCGTCDMNSKREIFWERNLIMSEKNINAERNLKRNFLSDGSFELRIYSESWLFLRIWK